MHAQHTGRIKSFALILAILVIITLLFSVFAGMNLYILQEDSAAANEQVESLFAYIDSTITTRNAQIEAEHDKHYKAVQSELHWVASKLTGSPLLYTQSQKDLLNIFAKSISASNRHACVIDKNGHIYAESYSGESDSEENDSEESASGVDNYWQRLHVSEETQKEILQGTRNDEGSYTQISYRMIEEYVDESMCHLFFSEKLQDENGNDTGYYLVNMEYKTTHSYSLSSMDFLDGLNSDIDLVAVMVENQLIVTTSDHKYQLISEVGLDEATLQDGFTGTVVYDGVRCDAQTRQYTLNGEVYAVLALHRYSRYSITRQLLLCAILYITILAAFICIGIFYLREAKPEMTEGENPKKRFWNRNIIKKLSPCLLIGVLIVVIGVLYITRMANISAAMVDMSTKQSDMLENISDSNNIDGLMKDLYGDDDTLLSQTVAMCLSYDPAMLSSDKTVPYFETASGHNTQITDANGDKVYCAYDCKELHSAIYYANLNSITIYNTDGYAIATDSTTIPDPIDESSAFYPVLMRRAASVTTQIGNFTASAVPLTLYTDIDETGNRSFISKEDYLTRVAQGSTTAQEMYAMIVTKVAIESDGSQSDFTGIAKLLSDNSMNYQYLLFEDDEEHTSLYISESISATDTESLSLSENFFRDETFTRLRLDGQYYFAYVKLYTITDFDNNSSTYWLATMVPDSSMYEGSLKRALMMGAVTLLCLLLLLGFFSYTGNHAQIPERATNPEKGKLDAGHKTLLLLRLIVMAYLLAIIILFATRWRDLNRISVMNWLLRFEWDHGVNLFSLTTVGLMSVAVIMLNFIIDRVVALLANMLNERMYACARLVASILRYASILFCVFYGLYLFGMNTMSVLASLGVFSTIVGLGANKLIADIVAGIFLIFEGDVRVGDIITINSFCGKVTEVGIRTTKIENMDGNINIVTNSTITNVLNMTRKASRVKVMLNLTNATEVSQAEEQFNAWLPRIREQCKIPFKDINYIGIDSFSSDSVTYRFEANCPEINLNAMYRYLYRSLMHLCKENGFTIK